MLALSAWRAVEVNQVLLEIGLSILLLGLTGRMAHYLWTTRFRVRPWDPRRHRWVLVVPVVLNILLMSSGLIIVLLNR